MNKKLTIALVAHDNRKADMVEWAVHNESSFPIITWYVPVQPEDLYAMPLMRKALALK